MDGGRLIASYFQRAIHLEINCMFLLFVVVVLFFLSWPVTE